MFIDFQDVQIYDHFTKINTINIYIRSFKVDNSVYTKLKY